jgi:hypothetical protein
VAFLFSAFADTLVIASKANAAQTLVMILDFILIFTL